jgi:hypothetical protein
VSRLADWFPGIATYLVLLFVWAWWPALAYWLASVILVGIVSFLYGVGVTLEKAERLRGGE